MLEKQSDFKRDIYWRSSCKQKVVIYENKASSDNKISIYQSFL